MHFTSHNLIQPNYSVHHFLNTDCIFFFFFPPEFSPEALTEDVDCDSFCGRKQNRLVFIFCFVKSFQNLMGEKTHKIISIKYKKIVQNSKKAICLSPIPTITYEFLLSVLRFRTNDTTSMTCWTVH